MVPQTHIAQNHPEFLIGWSILLIWPLWLIGGLYIAGPVLGMLLLFLALFGYYAAPVLPDDKRLLKPDWTVGLWLVAMVSMLPILWIGHAQASLGFATTLKSSIGWAKGWLLIAIFILAGAALPIRQEFLIRCVCRMGKITIIILPVFLLAPLLGLPQTLWASPLMIVGGPGPEYFEATLYTIEPGSSRARWQFFAPWSPAAGMIGIIFFLIALKERQNRWRLWGVAGALAVIIFSQSRLAWLGLVTILPIVYCTARLGRAWLWLLVALILPPLGWYSSDILLLFQEAQSDFMAARADSSRVRQTLARIAIERWQNEAFWFGHGVVETGPHLVEYMPIGSHHSWYGLLFVKGLTGLLALAIPMAVTFLALLRKAVSQSSWSLPFALAIVMVLYSFGENLEILAYLYWPALIVIGQGLKRPAS